MLQRVCKPLGMLVVWWLGLVGGVLGADSPFAGTWKIVLPEFRQGAESNPWLIKIDDQGQSLEVIAGVQPPFKEAKVLEVKNDGKTLRFSLAIPKAQTFSFVLIAPGKDQQGICGTVRFGAEVFPMWLEKTAQTEIDPANALQKVAGLGDLQAALKQPDDADKLKELAEISKANPGRPIALIAYQQRLGVLMRAKAKNEAIRQAIDDYVQGVQPYGPLLVLNTRLQMSNALRGNKETQALALENAQLAVKLLNDEVPRNLQLSAYLALTTSQFVLDEKKEAAQAVPTMKKIVEAILAELPAEQKLPGMQSLAGALLSSPVPEIGDLGLNYARAAHKLVPADAPEAQKLFMDKFLRNALATRGLKDEADKLSQLIEKTEQALDAAFEKQNIAFDLKKYPGRKGKSERVVVVEMFTGSQCPPCVSADIAFDAARKTFSAKEVVFLQYHLHVPGPDPMTNIDSEARQRYYGDEAVGGTPAVLIDGMVGPALGGTKDQAEDRYERLYEAVVKNLEKEAEASLRVQTQREADKLSVQTEVSKLKNPGANLKLRLALIEEVARYPGGNGQRLHHHVVRAMLGGAEGIALPKEENTHQITVDIEALRKSQAVYLTQFAQRTGAVFIDAPVAYKNLKVVAFVQDDDTKKILQAVQVAVPERR